MKFGIAIGGAPPQEFVKLAKNAEKHGFNSLWVADMSARDVYVTLTTLALNTQKVFLGTSVTNPYSRHPFHIAQAMASINELSNDRAIIGIGCGSKKNLLAPLSINRSLPVETVKESVIIIKQLLKGEKVNYIGKTISINNLKLDISPIQDIPIFIGARGSRMLKVAGEVADGVIISSLTTPSALKYSLDSVKLGAKEVNRKYSDIPIYIFVRICVSEDSYKAKQSIRKFVPYRIWDDAWSTLKKIGYNYHTVSEIKKEYEAGNFEVASSLVTDQMIEDFGIYGTVDECIEKIKKMEKVGVQGLIIVPVPSDTNQREDVIKIIAKEIIPKFS